MINHSSYYYDFWIGFIFICLFYSIWALLGRIGWYMFIDMWENSKFEFPSHTSLKYFTPTDIVGGPIIIMLAIIWYFINRGIIINTLVKDFRISVQKFKVNIKKEIEKEWDK